MIKVYLNYPNRLMTIHRDAECNYIQAWNKPDQRYCKVNYRTVAVELRKFRDHEYLFSSSQERNDLWLEIDFEDDKFELDVLDFIKRKLASQYTPFKDAKLTTHC